MDYFVRVNSFGGLIMDPNPKAIEVCALCRLVHDEALGGWLSKKTYRDATGINANSCDQSHTYCPECFAFCLAKIQRAA
jgi:hypothetical protein